MRDSAHLIVTLQSYKVSTLIISKIHDIFLHVSKLLPLNISHSIKQLNIISIRCFNDQCILKVDDKKSCVFDIKRFRVVGTFSLVLTLKLWYPLSS